MASFSNNENLTYITELDSSQVPSDSEKILSISNRSFINPAEIASAEDVNLDLNQPVETASLSTQDDETVSFSPEEYPEFLKEVQDYYDENIKFFRDAIFGDEENEGLKALYEQYYQDYNNTDFTNMSAYLASSQNMKIYTDALNNLLLNPEEELDQEKFFNTTGYSMEDFMNLDMDQKIEIIQKNQGYFLSHYNSVLIDFIQNYHENKEINTYGDIAQFFKKYPFLEDYEAAKDFLEEIHYSILSSLEMIRIFEGKKKTAYYDYLYSTSDFQNFRSDILTPFTEADVEKYRKYVSDYFEQYHDTVYNDVNYEEFHKHFPEVSPMKLIKLQQYIYGTTDYFGIKSCNFDYQTYCSLLKACKNNPDYITKYEYLYETYGYEAAEKYARDTLEEAHRIVGEYEANVDLSLLLDSKNNNDFVAFNVNSFVVSNIAGIHGMGDSLYGFSYAIEMIGNVLGIQEPTRVRSAIDYKRLYLASALMDHNDKVKNGIIRYDEESKQFVNADPDLSIIDFTRDYPGFKLNWEYNGLKMFGRYLPFMLLSTKCPTTARILAGISSAGRTYHEKMINGDDYMESVIFSTLQGVSYPIIGHYLQHIPIFIQKNDTSSIAAFLKTLASNLNKWAVKGTANVISRSITTKINELLSNYKSTGNLSIDEVNEVINLYYQDFPKLN